MKIILNKCDLNEYSRKQYDNGELLMRNLDIDKFTLSYYTYSLATRVTFEDGQQMLVLKDRNA